MTIATFTEQFRAAPVTGDYATDCATGRDMGDDLIARIQGGQLAGQLGFVVQDLVKRGRFGGVEVGFFHRVAEHIATA